MSLLTLPTLSAAPLKGSSESNRLFYTPSGASKCGEIFVTNNADKWTFFCEHCKKATTDIGDFICHIRLEHFNNGHHKDLGENDQTTKFPGVSGAPKEIVKAKKNTENGQQPTQSDSSIVSEENEDLPPNASEVPNISDVTLFRQPSASKESEIFPNKDTSSRISQQLETKYEIYAITEVGNDLEQEDQKEFVQVVYMNDGDNETPSNKNKENEEDSSNTDDNSHADGNVMSSYELSDDDNDDDNDDESSLECSKCNKRFKYVENLEKHILLKHNCPSLQCSVCKIICKRWCLFLAHVKAHASETCFPCEICGKVFKNHGKLKKHSKEQCLEKTCTCRKCLKQELRKKLVVDGVLDPASMNNESVTNIELSSNCSASLIDNDDISMDVDEESDIEFILPSGSSSTPKNAGNYSVYKCRFCIKRFSTERKLMNHIGKMHKNQNLTCYFCFKTFKTRTGLIIHERTHDKTNQLQCPVCPATEFRESLFIAHVITHESATCFPCQVCGRIFPNTAERLEHWRTHIEERPFGCPKCFRRFHKELILRNHMRCHLHYFCKNCRNYFQSDKTLKSPYYCGECKNLPHVKFALNQKR